MRLRWREDDGQLLLLVCVYMLVAAALVMVVIDVSKVFLYRRSLAAAADGAALAAAQSLDRETFYRQGAGELLPLDQETAASAVQAYLARADLATRFPELRYAEPQLSADGRTVTVRLESRMRLPFTGFFTGGDRSVDIGATASAQAATG